jgi:hypothetical protein
VLRPTVIAVGNFELDVSAALPVEPSLRLSPKLFDDLNAVHLSSKLSEDGRLVAKAGADLEDRVFGTDIKQVRHQRHDKRLRDRLAEADRNRNVGVGVSLKFDWYKFLPRNLFHRCHHSPVKGRLANYVAQLNGVGRNLRNHPAAHCLELFSSHGQSWDWKIVTPALSSRDNEISFLIRQSFVRMTVVPTPIGFSNVRNCCVRFCVFRLKRCN